MKELLTQQKPEGFHSKEGEGGGVMELISAEGEKYIFRAAALWQLFLFVLTKLLLLRLQLHC